MDRLEEIKLRDADWDYSSRLDACDDRRWLLGEVERLRAELKKSTSDVDTWRWEFGAASKRAEALDETSQIMKNNYDENIEELRFEIKRLRAAWDILANTKPVNGWIEVAPQFVREVLEGK